MDSIGESSVPNLAHGFPIKFQYYLPPCYDQLASHSFPTVYFILADFETRLSDTDNMPISLANRLIRADKIPPAIFVVPEPVLGVGFHVSLAEDLVPRVDGLFRTIRNRRFRGVGGYSHTAAIAARMAFQYPGLIGSVGVFSGGIAPSEIPQFETWVGETPKEFWPRVLFDIDDQDPIIVLTRNLSGVLDRHHVPMTSIWPQAATGKISACSWNRICSGLPPHGSLPKVVEKTAEEQGMESVLLTRSKGPL
jgi:hypothetical protein